MRTRLSESGLRLLADQAMKMRVYDSSLFPPSPYYRFLRILAGYHKPDLSVELGVCGGGGSLHLALGYPQGAVVGVDINWHQWPEAIGHLMRVCPNFVKWEGDSVTSAPAIAKLFGLVDLLFIDTVHTIDQTTQELQAWIPFLSGRAIVCFDDLCRDEMAGFWEKLPEPKLRLDQLHLNQPRSGQLDSIDGGGFGVAWSRRK